MPAKNISAVRETTVQLLIALGESRDILESLSLVQLNTIIDKHTAWIADGQHPTVNLTTIKECNEAVLNHTKRVLEAAGDYKSGQKTDLDFKRAISGDASDNVDESKQKTSKLSDSMIRRVREIRGY